jgi:hypothetical protein
MLAAVGVSVFLAWTQGAQLLQQGIRLSLPLVILSFAVECAGLFIAVPIWRRVLSGYGIHHLWRDDLRLYCYGALGAVLPGSIWTIAGRSVLYQRLGDSSVRVAAASVMEALLIGVAATGVYGTTLLIHPETSIWQQPVLGMVVVAFALVLLHPRIFNRISTEILTRTGSACEDASIPAFRTRDLLTWIILDGGMVVIGGTALFILLLSLIAVGTDVWVLVVAAWAAASIAGNLFFWLPGTAILRDGALVLAVAPSLGLPTAVLFAVLAHAWSIISLLVVAGLIWLILDLPSWSRRYRGIPPSRDG